VDRHRSTRIGSPTVVRRSRLAMCQKELIAAEPSVTAAELKNSTKNNIRLVQQIMSLRENQIMGRMIFEVMQTSRNYYTYSFDMLTHGMASVAQFYSERAAGTHLDSHNHHVLAMLNDIVVAECFDFPALWHMDDGPAPTGDDEGAIVLQDRATLFTSLIIETVRHRTNSQNVYSMTFPHMLAVGLHDDPTIAMDGMENCKTVWSDVCVEGNACRLY
jgi:hypothetical protein